MSGGGQVGVLVFVLVGVLVDGGHVGVLVFVLVGV